MRSLQEHITETQQWMDAPAAGDDFAINIREECLLESHVVEVTGDAIVIEADDQMIAMMEQYGLLGKEITMEQIRRYGAVGSNRAQGFTVAEGDIDPNRHPQTRDYGRGDDDKDEDKRVPQTRLDDPWAAVSSEPDGVGADPGMKDPGKYDDPWDYVQDSEQDFRRVMELAGVKETEANTTDPLADKAAALAPVGADGGQEPVTTMDETQALNQHLSRIRELAGMADRKPFAEHDGRDDEEEEIDDDGLTMADRARRDGRGGDDGEEPETAAQRRRRSLQATRDFNRGRRADSMREGVAEGKAENAWNAGISDEDFIEKFGKSEFDRLTKKYGTSSIPVPDLVGYKAKEPTDPKIRLHRGLDGPGAKLKSLIKKQGVEEGSEEQVYKVVAVDKSNALKKPTKLNVKASSIEDVFSRLAANDWYALSINGVEVIAGKRLKQGVAEAAKWRTHPDAHDINDDGDIYPKTRDMFAYDPLSRRQSTAGDARTARGKKSALKTSLKMAQGRHGPKGQLPEEQGVAEGSADQPGATGSVQLLRKDYDLDQQIWTFDVNGDEISFLTYGDYDDPRSRFNDPDPGEILGMVQRRTEPYEMITPDQQRAIADMIYRELKKGVQHLPPAMPPAQDMAEGVMSDVDMDLRHIARTQRMDALVDAMRGEFGIRTQQYLQDMMDEVEHSLQQRGQGAREDMRMKLRMLMDRIQEIYANQEISEAEYQGRKVELNKPTRGDVAKFKVYVKDPKTGNVKKVNFGDKTMRIKKSNPARRKSFRARHRCENPGPKTKARYWSCRKW